MEQRCSNVQRHLEPVHPTFVKWPYPNNPYPSRTHGIEGSQRTKFTHFAVQGAGKAQGQTYEPQIGNPTKTPKKCGEQRLDPTPPDPTTKKTHSHQTTMYLDHHAKLLFLLLKVIFSCFFYKETELSIFGAGDVTRYITERPHNAQIQLRSISDVPRETLSRSY